MDINIADNLQGLQEEELHSRQGALHQYILSFMAMLGLLLEVKQTARSKSPFVIDHLNMLTFIVVLFICIWSLATVKIVRLPILDLAKIMNNISLLFGSLASILLLLILVQAFGWFTLCLWIIYFVRDIVTKESYMKTLAYVRDRVEELFKGQENIEAAESVVQTQDVGEQNLDEMEEHNVVQIQDPGEQNVDENEMEEQNVKGYMMEEPNGLPRLKGIEHNISSQFALFFWSICFVALAIKSYQYSKTHCESAVAALVVTLGEVQVKLNAINDPLDGK